MELIVNNHIITEPIKNIVEQLKSEATWDVFSTIQDKGDYLRVTCPYHKEGHENRPSCSIYSNYDGNIEPGFLHCFTCGEAEPLYKVVGFVLGINDESAKEWLIDRFDNSIIEKTFWMPELDINTKSNDSSIIDENKLLDFAYIHPYMYNRKLTDEVINKFKIGYDKETDSIVFPVWDELGNLVMITKRSVTGKKYYIQANKKKPVYLLNYIIKENIDTVYVCESQINALTLWTWGYPAIALIGTGSKEQYEILKVSGVRNYILCFDGDNAGKKGTQRFLNAMNNNVFIIVKDIPNGKDVNDLTKGEFDSLPIL